MQPSGMAMVVIGLVLFFFFAWISTRGGKVAEIPNRSGDGLHFFIKGLIWLFFLVMGAAVLLSIFQGMYPGK